MSSDHYLPYTVVTKIKWKNSKWTWFVKVSHSVMSDPSQPHGLFSPQNSPGKNTGVGNLSLLQGIFPTQGPNPGLPHCRQTLYKLNHQRSPRILEWVAYPFSSWSSQHRNWTGVSCIADGIYTNWVIREARTRFAHCKYICKYHHYY